MQQRSPNNPQGIDVSHYQGEIDWTQFKAAGKTFAIIKATEGQSFVDQNVYLNYSGAKSAGMAVGLYHFCRAKNPDDAVKEAAFFATVFDACGGLVGLDIPPILDIETVQTEDSTVILAICKAFLEYLEKRYGVKPIIYSFPSFMDFYMDDSLSSYPLWYANYGDTLADDHAGWSQWTFLQYTDQGTVPGVNGAVDLNEYAGSVDDLLYKMSPDDANKVITFLAAAHGLATTDQDKAEFHRLANELRKVSGQEVQP